MHPAGGDDPAAGVAPLDLAIAGLGGRIISYIGGFFRPLRVMQHGQCAHARAKVGTAHHLHALVHPYTHAHRARTPADSDATAAPPHAYRHLAGGDTNAHTHGGQTTAAQQTSRHEARGGAGKTESNPTYRSMIGGWRGAGISHSTPRAGGDGALPCASEWHTI